MRFFIPGSNDVAHGEQMYRQTLDQLREHVHNVSDRRICRLKFRRDGRMMNVSVGDSFGAKREPVFAIYETDRGFVILMSAYGPPAMDNVIEIPFDGALEVEDFTAVA